MQSALLKSLGDSELCLLAYHPPYPVPFNLLEVPGQLFTSPRQSESTDWAELFSEGGLLQGHTRRWWQSQWPQGVCDSS